MTDKPRVVILSRTHDRDLTATILRDDQRAFEFLCLPMQDDPDHPLGRVRQWRKPTDQGAVLQFGRGVRVEAESGDITGQSNYGNAPEPTFFGTTFRGPTPKKRTTRRQRKERERMHERAFAQHLRNKTKKQRRIKHWSRVSHSLAAQHPDSRSQDTVDALGYAWRTMFERSKTSP